MPTDSEGTVVPLTVIRKRISWLLNAAVVLIVVVLVAVCLGLILSMAGDSSGYDAVRGLTYLVLSVLGIDLLVLIGHLAIAVVLLLERVESEGDSSQDECDSGLKSSS